MWITATIRKKVDPLRPLLKPEQLWLKKDELYAHLKHFGQTWLCVDAIDEKAGRSNQPLSPLPTLAVQQQNKEPLAQLRQFSESFSGKIIFSVESEGRREALSELLQGVKLKPHACASLSEALAHNHKFTLVIGASEHGFIHNTLNFAFVCESDLLGDRVIQRRKKRQAQRQQRYRDSSSGGAETRTTSGTHRSRYWPLHWFRNA